MKFLIQQHNAPMTLANVDATSRNSTLIIYSS